MAASVSLPVPGPIITTDEPNCRTTITNFREICRNLKRRDGTGKAHLRTFLYSTFETSGTYDDIKGGQFLVHLNRVLALRAIKNAIDEYIRLYVNCQAGNCNSRNTKLEFNTIDSVYYLRCLDCGQRRSVRPIVSPTGTRLVSS